MSKARVVLMWDPDGRRKRLRRRAATTAVASVMFLWALSRTTAPDAPNGGALATAVPTSPPAPVGDRPPPPDVPSLSPARASLDFGEWPVGAPSTERDLTFWNNGTVPFAPSGILFAGDHAAAFEVDLGTCRRVAAGARCAATAVFRPVAVGKNRTEVSLVDRSGARSTAVTLSGRGTRPRPPRRHHVGFEASLIQVAQGATEKVSIRNTGEDEAAIGRIAVDDEASFKLTSDDCKGQRLAPGRACVATVTATPDRSVQFSTMRLFDEAGHLEDVVAVTNPQVGRQAPVTSLPPKKNLGPVRPQDIVDPR
jgi:hypothetical protein